MRPVSLRSLRRDEGMSKFNIQYGLEEGKFLRYPTSNPTSALLEIFPGHLSPIKVCGTNKELVMSGAFFELIRPQFINLCLKIVLPHEFQAFVNRPDIAAALKTCRPPMSIADVRRELGITTAEYHRGIYNAGLIDRNGNLTDQGHSIALIIQNNIYWAGEAFINYKPYWEGMCRT